MSFLHFYLLGGMALVGVPILVHLVTREKPKHLRFPAFRFLVQKFQTNRRKLRLHHLLLLLLRMLLIGALCFALARPQLHSERLAFLGGNQPILAVLVVDTSPSMEFERGGLTRLEDARRRALELLEEVPEGSRIALLDTAQQGGQFESAVTVREQIKALQIKPANNAVSRILEQAYKLLNEEAESRGGEGELARFLYVFSDRTRASWDQADVRGLKQPEGVSLVYVDVGAEKPIDLAIEKVEIDPPAVPPGSIAQVRVFLRATGEKADLKLTCQINNDPRLQEALVKMAADTQQVVTFDYRAAALGADPMRDTGLPAGTHQVTLKLEGNDRLPFNNVHHGTFIVRPGRKVLTLMDEVKPQPWTLALEVLKFTSVVRSIRDLDSVKQLEDFDVICLHQVTDPSAQWKRLSGYVSAGGKLVIIPGKTMDNAAYSDHPLAKELLPARFVRTEDSDRGGGTGWDWSLSNNAPLMAPFLRWKREQSDLEFWKLGGEPKVHRWWEVKPKPEWRVIATLADEKHSPALMERNVERGKVLLFTTKLDIEREAIHKGSTRIPWQNYWSNSFGFVLVDKVCRYLAGDSVAPDWNYQCGQTVTIPLARDAGEQFLLRGPGQPVQGLALSLPPEDKEQKDRLLAITQAQLPGNYIVYSVRNDRQEVLEAFSMNVKPEESILLPRVPKEDIEEILGKDTVLGVDHNRSLKEAISNRPQPIELLPWLMLLLLLFLAGENLLGNRSLDRNPLVNRPTAEPKPAWRSLLMVLLCLALGIALGYTLSFLQEGVSGSRLGLVVVVGLLGLFHGLVTVAQFNPRDGAIFGGLLGSIAGVLFGLLVLGSMSNFDGTFAVVFGMILGAGLLALDGWLLGLRLKPVETPKPIRAQETAELNV